LRMWQLLKRAVSIVTAALFIVCPATPAQTGSAPPLGLPAISRVEGTDPGSGTHYVRFSAPSPIPGKDPGLAPRFTLECRDVKGKHDLLWFLSFGGVPVQPFEPPFQPSQGNLFPPRYPKVKLKMDFEGYMRTKPLVRAWEALPSGEFRFCNAGMECPNMETARFYMSFLNSLPGLRISFAKPSPGDPPEVFFELRSLIDEANRTPLCTP